MRKIWIYLIVLILELTACATNIRDIQGQLEIHDIQGCSHTSPYLGQRVADVVGVVTHKTSNGFTMQSLTSDDQLCSSEAIFVFTKEYPQVLLADLVQVDGVVEEFTDGSPQDHNLSQTEINNARFQILYSDYQLPNPIVIDDLLGLMPTAIIDNDDMKLFDPKQDGIDFYESLESMLVEIRSGQVVAHRNIFDEISVLPSVFIAENLLSIQGALVNTQNDANPEKLMIKLPSNSDGEVNVGDWFEESIIGIMDYSYGNFKLLAFTQIDFARKETTVEPYIPTSGSLTLATYNVENLSPMDGNKKYSQIAGHIVDHLHSPDVLVLNEISDNSGSIDDGVVKADKTIMKLLEAIHKAGGPEYSYSDTPPDNNQDGGLEGGNIRTVLLFRNDKGITLDQSRSLSNKVTANNGTLLLNDNPFLIGNQSTAFYGTRKPRVWLLSQNNKQFIVVGVHLSSQGANTPDWGNLQPPQKPEETKRINQAQLIFDQLREIYMKNPQLPIFIMGDMNDQPWSTTISVLSQDIFFNTAEIEKHEERYSYIFEGNAQELDYILINKNLADDVIQARFIHVNSFKDLAESISDHDPVIIDFDMSH
ncbi:MAG: hypothetical protein CVU42_17035 [Chloroflexi bacterium HGW-Chloroflexi-4]|jgi:hypothetical protein|nr:MAG: hypothetical protein CVU42_17035 [Chloroflexi bacterium HGW-Chloroflexi-4]